MQERRVKVDPSQAWSEATSLLKRGGEPLLTLAGFFVMLPSLLAGFLLPIGDRQNQTLIEVWQEMNAWFAANWTWLVIVWCFSAIGRLAILILMASPSRPTVLEAIKAGLSLLPTALFAEILFALMMSLGLMLFIVPGIYLGARFFPLTAVIATERMRSPFGALARTFAVTRGNGWRIVFLLAIILLAFLILQGAILTVVGVLAALTASSGFGGFLLEFFRALLDAGLTLVLLLVAIAVYRQLVDDRHMRRSVAR
jgi:hypothetical protein